MAITPPGADPLARIRALVGNGADPIPTPMTSPDEGLAPTPMTNIDALPSSVVTPVAPAAPQFDPTIDAPVGLVDEVEGVPEVDMSPIAAGAVSAHEQEAEKWVQLHKVPIEMAPVVARRAMEAGVTPEALLKEGRPWSDAFPSEEMETIEKEAAAVTAFKTGFLEVHRAPGDTLDIESLPAIGSVATREEPGLPTDPEPESPRDTRWREYERRLSGFYESLKAKKMGPPNKREFGVVTYWNLSPEERAGWPAGSTGAWDDAARAEWSALAGDFSHAGTMASGHLKFPFTDARDVPGDLLGPAFTDDALEQRFDAQKEEYFAKRLGPAYHERTTYPFDQREVKGVVAQAEFEKLEVPRIVLSRAATDSEVSAAVRDRYREERAAHKEKIRARNLENARKGGTGKPSWEQRRIDSNESNYIHREEQRETKNTLRWHQSRRNLLVPPAPPEGGGLSHAEIMVQYHAAEGDPAKQQQILDSHPRLKPGAPLTAGGVEFEKRLEELTPQAVSVFRKVKHSRRQADQLVWFKMFGIAPIEHIRAVVGRLPDGNAKIDYVVDPEVAPSYLAPTKDETPEEEEARVNQIVSAYVRKRHLEHHADYLIQREESIADLSRGAQKVSPVDLGDLKRAPGLPVGMGDLTDPSLPVSDTRKNLLVSELNVDAVRQGLIGGEDPELLKTAATVGFTEEAVVRALSAQFSDDSKIRSTAKNRKLDPKVVKMVFSALSDLGDVDADAIGSSL